MNIISASASSCIITYDIERIPVVSNESYELTQANRDEFRNVVSSTSWSDIPDDEETILD